MSDTGFEAIRLTVLGNHLYIFAQVAEKLRIFHFSIDKSEKIMYNSNGYIFINTDQELMTGDIAKVRVTGAYEYDLIGELI